MNRPIVDGGMETGFDVFKALALGADAVTVGKALIPMIKQGPEAVEEKIRQMTAQLQAMMIRTGTKDLQHMDASVVRPPD